MNNSLENNSYLYSFNNKNFHENSSDLSSRSINNINLDISQNVSQQIQKNFITSCNLFEIVIQMKNFKIEKPKMIREYLIKKGLKLFHDLNENLNAYK